jgi:hypothetical protein
MIIFPYIPAKGKCHQQTEKKYIFRKCRGKSWNSYKNKSDEIWKKNNNKSNTKEIMQK